MSDYTELCARLRRMSDMTTTNNDIRDVLRAADAIESQALEIAELRAERDHLASRYDAVVREQSEHCKDCCCARSWAALGITKYTGKSIPEHIEELRQRCGDVLAVIHGDGGHHTDAVGFDRSCADAVERWYGLIIENDALRAKLEAAEKDAARYRWIRQSTADIEGPAAYAPWCGPPLFDAALDAATDAAIDAARKEGK